MIRPYNPVLEVSPFERLRVADYGDLSVNPVSIEDTYARITAGLKPVLDAGAIPMSVGGDHSILLPILRAIHGCTLRYLGSVLGHEVFARHSGTPRDRRGPAG
jgi:arginase family enzyme